MKKSITPKLSKAQRTFIEGMRNGIPLHRMQCRIATILILRNIGLIENDGKYSIKLTELGHSFKL